MAKLFESTEIRSLAMANRSVRSATWTGLGDSKGFVTDKAVEFYRTLGRGDVGLIITGYQYILPNGIQLPFMIGNYTDAQIEGLGRLAAAVHEGAGKVVGQIVHCGLRANPKAFPEPGDVWAPTALPGELSGAEAKEVTRQEILALVEAYAAAALRLRKAGFDGVQLHGAHGYGINQFLSAAWNKRGDGYGGSLRNRYRFLGEVMEAVRGAVGDDFPVMIKLNGHDFVDGGIVPDESIEIARRLTDDGIDSIEVSGGSSASPKNMGPMRTGIDEESQEAYLLEFAAAIKAATAVPVMTVGGIRSLKIVEDVLESGKADYVAMSRPFIREPHLIKRWKSGDTRRASCISCGGCFATGFKGEGISCKEERKTKGEES